MTEYDLHLRIIESLHNPNNLRTLLERVQKHQNLEEVQRICTDLLAIFVRTNPVGDARFSAASKCARILLKKFDYLIISKEIYLLHLEARKEKDDEMTEMPRLLFWK